MSRKPTKISAASIIGDQTSGAAFRSIVATPCLGLAPNTFERNIICQSQGAIFVSQAEGTLRERQKSNDSLGTWDKNLYFDIRGPNDLRFFNRTFKEWQSLGLDTHSKVANLEFVNLERGDFRLKSVCPGFALGFQPFDNGEAGLYDSEWADEAKHQQCAFRSLPPARR